MERILDERYVRPFRDMITSPPNISFRETSMSTAVKGVEETFRLNRDKIILAKLKKQPGVILHGGQNINLQVDAFGLSPSLKRPTYDYDMYSTTPEQHARDMANHINSLYGCNFAKLVKVPMPLAPFSSRKRNPKEKHVYRVMSPITPQGDAEVDYVYPLSDVKTEKINGLEVESLECLVTPSRVNMTAQGKRWMKTYRDVRRVKEIIIEKRRRGLE